jgi:hypothetical protein
MNNNIPTIYTYQSVEKRDYLNRSYNMLILDEASVFNPIKPKFLSASLKVVKSERVFMKVFWELYGLYKKDDYKFISGLKPITVNDKEYFFGDFKNIKTKEKSLFTLDFNYYGIVVICLYKGFYPDRDTLYQEIYKLINESIELLNGISKFRKFGS